MEMSLGQLAEYIVSLGMACEVDGDPTVQVGSVATLDEAEPGQISFLSNPRYESKVAETQASAVLVSAEYCSPRKMNLLRTPDPYAAMTAAIVRLHGYRRHPRWGMSSQATIASTSKVGADPNIAPYVYVDDDVVIGDRATIYPGVYIARGSRIGHDVTLFPNVVLYEKCILGDRVTIHAGSVIGEDGLGYAPVNGKWVKIPQVGNVVLGDDVEIGTDCAIDRATLGSTVIGSGTKFSNLVAIGHGTRIGEDCLFVAQVGVAGSVQVGRHVTMAGQVGVVGHITIGDNVRIGAKAGVINSIGAGQSVLGQPAVPVQEAKRQVAVAQRLPELKKEMRRLRQELDELGRRFETRDEGCEPSPRGE